MDGNCRFLTKRLWGAANEPPFFHHGLFTTLRQLGARARRRGARLAPRVRGAARVRARRAHRIPEDAAGAAAGHEGSHRRRDVPRAGLAAGRHAGDDGRRRIWSGRDERARSCSLLAAQLAAPASGRAGARRRRRAAWRSWCSPISSARSARSSPGRFASCRRRAIDGVDVTVHFKHFPLGIHPDAPLAHQAALAAAEQDKFWEMHDLLFANRQHAQREDLIGYAKQLGPRRRALRRRPGQRPDQAGDRGRRGGRRPAPRRRDADLLRQRQASTRAPDRWRS